MAKRRATSTAMSVYRAPAYRAPQPIVIRAPAPIVRRSRRRRSRSSGAGGGLLGSGGAGRPIAVALGAAVIGLAETSGVMAKLPAIPLVGRKGALALLAYYYSKHGGGSLSRDVCIAAAALSGYELATKGSISGEDV